MIIVKEKTIMVSKGDTFNTLFYVDPDKGYKFDGTETITFNIKERTDDTGSPLVSIRCGIDTLNNIISVYATKTEMAVLGEGNYLYDLVMDKNGVRITLLYPAKFIVKGVVHNE